MTGTFGSLNIAKTALQYQQIVMDVADNNIANLETTGYTRKRVDGAEIGGTTSPTMVSTYTGHGDGVVAQSVQRLSDTLLDTRNRRENANLSYLSVQQDSLGRVEAGIDEPSDTGVNQAISDFKSALQDLSNNPNVPADREAALAKAQTLAAAVNARATNLSDETADLHTNAVDDVASVNDDASQIATLNHQIFVASASGTDVSDLQDQRDRVALDLANKAGAVVSVQDDGRYTVTIAGATIVDGTAGGDNKPGTLAVASPATPLGFTLTQPASATTTTLTPATQLGGELGGIQTLTNQTLASYKTSLDSVAASLADGVNSLQTSGYDASGNPTTGVKLFDYTAGDAAATLAVVLPSSDDLAASATAPVPPATTTYDGSNADAMATALDGVANQYQTVVSTMGAVVAGVNSQTTNQQALVTQVGDEQQQLSGVSTDEETINLMQAQRAYEAAGRAMTVLDSVLDTLINHTGVTV